jgi:hypothetical protein
MRTRKTNNWKKEYSTTYLRQQGGRNFKIISTDIMKYFGWHLGTIFTKDIQKSILNTGYDLTKIKVVDEEGNDVKLSVS